MKPHCEDCSASETSRPYFEALESGVGDAQAITVDGKHAVFGFDSRVGLIEGTAQRGESGVGSLDLTSEAGRSLPSGGGLSLELADEFLVLLGFDTTRIKARDGFSPARFKVS